jgi:hypothetical protein
MIAMTAATSNGLPERHGAAEGLIMCASVYETTPERATVQKSPAGLEMYLVNRPTPVDHEHVPDDLIGHMAREEEDGADQIFRLIPPARGQHLRGGPLLVAWTLENHLP